LHIFSKKMKKNFSSARVSTDVACFLGFLGGGGAERVILNLTKGFVNRGFNVDLVLANTGSPHLWQVPPEVNIVDLKARKLSSSLPALVGYLRRVRPPALLSTLHYTNEIAIAAKHFARVDTRVVVREANQLSLDVGQSKAWKKRAIPWFVRYLYPLADGVVTVSRGVAEDLSRVCGLPLEKIQVIYNPTITPDLGIKAEEPLNHSWFEPGQPPVILAVGKLQAQKDFPTLIRAFSRVRERTSARLMILGWGPDRSQLEALVAELGLQEDVALPDHVANPYAYMKRAAVFVLSSAWEGLPNVLIEAMAVGIPVVSTDCKSGPSEILKEGEYGLLIPVGNPQAMAEAILTVLSGSSRAIASDWLEQFSLDYAVNKYLEILQVR
jgi:glycosyltransferase involved in cell wall biosynthesis